MPTGKLSFLLFQMKKWHFFVWEKTSKGKNEKFIKKIALNMTNLHSFLFNFWQEIGLKDESFLGEKFINLMYFCNVLDSDYFVKTDFFLQFMVKH